MLEFVGCRRGEVDLGALGDQVSEEDVVFYGDTGVV
jgi:hypothetical protein